MEIAILKDGEITFGDYRTMFPNTSFTPEGPSDEFLVQHGAKKLNRFKPYDSLTQKLVQVAPYDDGEFVSVVQVENLTAEEIQSAKDSAMAQLRSLRNAMLSATDWRFRSDLTPSADWVAYCQALRDFPATVVDARLPWQFPKDPDYKPKND